jgi:hypothetical protein
MRILLWIFLFECFGAMAAAAQELRLKGLVIPLFEHTVAVEYLNKKKWSVQLGYQNHVELGDNVYYHHRLTPSIRYYLSSDRVFLHGLFGEAFHRSSFIRHIPDQSDVTLKKYQSQSVGIAFGKQIYFRSRNMFMEFSWGRYLIYQGNFWVDRPRFDIFIHGDDMRTRLDFKLGFRLHSRQKKPDLQ